MGAINDLPLVSIVVPVFQAEQYLRESLDSILAQTYPHLEVITMDDASTDGSAAIIASYDDRRLRTIRQPVNRGIFGNINDGIVRAHGSLIAIHHADDVYDSEIVEREVRFLNAQPETGAVFTTDIFIDPAGREFGRLALPIEVRSKRTLSFEDVVNSFLCYQNSFIRGGTSLIRKEVYEAVGLFDETLSLRGDLEMWLRISHSYSIAILDEPLVRYRYGHENSSKQYDQLRTEPELFFEIMDRLLATAPPGLATSQALAAYEGHRAADRIMLAVNAYILGDRPAMTMHLQRTSARRLLATTRIQRWRLLVLLVGLHFLAMLPRIAPVAAIFRRRWHEKDYYARSRRRRSRSMVAGA